MKRYGKGLGKGGGLPDLCDLIVLHALFAAVELAMLGFVWERSSGVIITNIKLIR